MKENVRLVFEALISKLYKDEELVELNMDYDSQEKIYKCYVIGECGRIAFEGYAWISNGVVITRER